MSGGSWDYIYGRVEECGDRLMLSESTERRALGKLVLVVAQALHDIEWVDSSDMSPGDEIPAIRKALGHNFSVLVADVIADRLEKDITEATKALAELRGHK